MQNTLTYRQLQSLIQVSNVLNSSLRIEQIIDSIMRQTISVIDAADGGVLFLYDEGLDLLIPTSSHGFKSGVLRNVRLKPGESMTGLTFSAKECRIFATEEVVRRSIQTLSPENLDLMERSIPAYPCSTICAPILVRGACIGVITLDSFRSEVLFTDEDVSLLRAISHQAAVALEKANLYQEKEAAVQELEKLNLTISQQNELLSRSFDIHNSLADLALNGKGLREIIRFIHHMTGHHTLLYNDAGEQIAAACSSRLSPAQLDYVQPLLSLTGDTAQTSLEQVIDGIQCQYLLFPLGSKIDSLGTLVIVATDRIEEIDVAAFEHTCTVVSLELVKERALFDMQQSLQGEFIHELSAGRINDTMIQRAKLLQFDPARSYSTMIVHLDSTAQAKLPTESMLRQLVQIINKLLQDVRAIAVKRQEQIIILISYPPKVSPAYPVSHMKELAGRIQAEIQARNWGLTFFIGIGRVKAGLSQAYKSLQEATRCIQFTQSYRQMNTAVSYSDLGVQRLLLQNSEEDLLDFIQEVLGPLIAYDESRKGELLQTLSVYLSLHTNVKEAARALHIHPNTLLYRLRRIEEILQLDLADSQQSLNIQLSVSMYQYLQGKGSCNGE